MVIPYISREDVSAALASLIHTTTKAESSGLEHLLLVDLLAAAPDMPAGEDMRRFVVRELLVTEIASAVDQGRRSFDLSAPDGRESLAEALASLAETVATDSHELLAWSILYYRFVRADLSLSVDSLAERIGVHTRTIARYGDDGIELLTQRLIRAEQDARRRHLQRRLYAQLPYSVPLHLVGREDLLNHAAEVLPSLSPRHLLITGATGIGKTAFVQELLRRQIDAGNLDQLVWLDQPGSVPVIRQQVSEALLARNESAWDDGQVSLRDYLLLFRVAVVLDEVEAAASDAEAFADLLRDLGAALVCLISRTVVVIESVAARLHLPEIAGADVEAVVGDMLRLRPVLSVDDQREIARGLYDRVGGNPLALRLAAGLWEESEDWQALETEVHERLLARLFMGLSDEEQRGWLALALCPRPTAVGELVTMWSIRLEAVGVLVRLALAEQNELGAVMLVGAARDYVRREYAANSEFRALLDDLIAQLELDNRAADIVEQALITGFPELDHQRRTEWISRMWEEGFRRGHWAHWRAILESLLQDSAAVEPDLRIAYGICLRHLADWDSAREVFYAVVAECGRDGRFAEQARALQEWSILARNQGDYAQALSLIGQARRYALRVRDDDRLRSLMRHEAQMLIHAGRAGEAHKLLTALPETTQNLALQSEALLVLRNHSGCRSLAVRALRLLDSDPATEASLYTIIGRSYEHQGSHDQAHGYLTDAVTLLERGDDPFALARAQTNLAAVLIPMRRYRDAGTLLARAEAIQSRLGDRVGLSATRHNRTIMGGYIAR